MSDDLTDKSGFYSNVGWAAIILAVCFGVPSCEVLEAKADQIKARTAREAAVPHAAPAPAQPPG